MTEETENPIGEKTEYRNSPEDRTENSRNNETGHRYIVMALLGALLLITVFQSYQISSLASEIQGIEVTGKVTTSSGGDTGSTGSSSSGTPTLQQVLEEITPTGTPDYGEEAGVSYEEVESSLKTLMGYHREIELSGDHKDRYIGIATSENTACEFCCGIGNAGFGRSDGSIACGCSHNLASSGLTKWLIKNTDYTDQEIKDEIQNWKVLFFPRDSVKEELERRNINPESAGLPAMVGGC